MTDYGDPLILPRPDLTLTRNPPRPDPPIMPRPRPLSTPPRPAPPVTSTPRPNIRPSEFRYTSTWAGDHRYRDSTSFKDWRYNSTSSRDGRFTPIRQRSSFHESIRTAASSAWQETARRSEPLRRAARPHVRSAQEWAGSMRRQVIGAGGAAPLLTPGRDRRAAVVLNRSVTPDSARNSPGVGRAATLRATSAARTMRWEATSGLEALVECGAAAGRAAAAGTGHVCAMADAKLQQLRRSISSWSLSTVKKPKVTLPKLKKPKLKLFGGNRKNRVDPKTDAATTEKVKAALLKAEGAEGAAEGAEEGATKQEGEEGQGEVIHNVTTTTATKETQESEAQPSDVLTVHHPNTPPHDPGLLAASDDLEFIDSDDPQASGKVCEAISLGVDYADHWFDAKGTMVRPKSYVESAAENYKDVRTTKYYDAVDNTILPPMDEAPVPSKDNKCKEDQGSAKAREWVKSFNEEAESRIENIMKMQKPRDSSSLPKSKSEIRLDNINEPHEKWTKRDEIKLNTAAQEDDDVMPQENSEVKKTENENQAVSAKENIARKESIKKIFQIRGKLSLKSFGDSQRSKYTDTDISLASTPYALTNTYTNIQASDIRDCLDVSDDGINLDPAGEPSTNSEKIPQVIEPKVKDDHEDVENKIKVAGNYEDLEAITVEKEDIDLALIETKKKKMPGTGLPKSIKNFAGSIFSGKGKKEGEGDKKKKERTSPFTKDYLFKRSTKTKIEEVLPSEKNTGSETEDISTIPIKIIPEIKDDNENSLTKAACENSDSTPVADIKEEINKDEGNTIEESLLDVLPRSTTNSHNLRASPEKLALLLPNEYDDRKSSSHESSPGLDTSFVEEDGLRLRKDALLAIKSMEDDDAGTHFYSFLSTSEYHTPLRGMEEKTYGASKVPAESSAATKVHEETAIASKVSEDIATGTKIAEKTVIKFCTPEPAKTLPNISNKEKEVENDIKKVIDKEECDGMKQGPTQEASHVPQIDGPPQPQDKTPECYIQNDVDEKNRRNIEVGVSKPKHSTSSEAVVTSPKYTPVKEAHDSSSPPLATSAVCDTVPVEVPKLKLDQVLTVESDVPPKPSPRTKKGRYGYAALGAKVKPAAPLNQTLENSSEHIKSDITSNGSSGNKIDSSMLATFPRRHASTKKKDPIVEHERTSSDSGYAGPTNSYFSGIPSRSDEIEVEPIYWEITENKDDPPRPSPRSKKEPQFFGEPYLATNGDSSSASSQSEVKHVPEWLNRRAPIPSPRAKKQRSLQSLPNVVPAEGSMEEVKKKLQFLSQSGQVDDMRQGRTKISVREGDQFYSGKAASISYGFTPTAPPPKQIAIPQPSSPQHGRKASQMSLPAAMATEEMQSRQQKRISLHGDQVNPNERNHIPLPRPRSIRRRRTDPTQGMNLQTIKFAVQHVGKKVVDLTDLLTAMGLRHLASFKKSEELLSDVLYSVYSLMGCAGGGVWAVGGTQVTTPTPARTCVTMDQVTQVLQAAFHVTQETMDRVTKDVRSRPAPVVKLQLTLKEAKDLRAKTVKGTTNPYVTVSVPSTGQSHRTRLEKDTLNPKWNQEFTLLLKNLQTDTVNIQIWHEHDSVTVKQITKVKDIRALGRLVKGTTAQAKDQASFLLGVVTLNVKDISQRGAVNDWYNLKKKGPEGGVQPAPEGGDMGTLGKDRGTIHLAASVGSSSSQLGVNDRRSFDSLLAHLIHHQLMATDNNNEESNWSRPWPGRVSAAAAAALAQYAITLDLTDADVHLSWWRVGSQVTSADPAWILSQLHQVQAALGKRAYQGESLTELQDSLAKFVRAKTEKLKDLHNTYPATSGILAQHHLTSTLKTLQAMQNHHATRCLLDQEDFLDLPQMVHNSLDTHTKHWWSATIEEQLQGCRTADEQITGVINIVAETHSFLNIIAEFYNPILMKEMGLAYMETTYLSLSNKIKPCVRPLVMNLYNRMPAIGTMETEGSSDGNYSLEVGTSLWQLYRNLGRLHTLGKHLPPEAQSESGVVEYHRWFSRGVMRWLELAVMRAQSMIGRAVELDTLELVDPICNFSSSATDTIGIFHDVKNWWVKLAWPDPENSAVLLAKILEDVCSCGTKYSDLVREKVQTMFSQESSTLITRPICVGLNNIDRVRQELTGLPALFGFEGLLEEVRRGKGGRGVGAAGQLAATVDRLISSAAENMEAKVNEFVESVIEKMRRRLENAVTESCETQSSSPLLSRTMDPTLELLRNHLNNSNFQRFLWRTWETTLELFNENVTRNAERRKANYFCGVYNILEATLKFFTPKEGVGLDRESAQTPEYTNLVSLLESLRMTTESLIAKYYQERYEEQVEEVLPARAQLVVKLLFTRPGKLIVEVIMARDMVVEGDSGSIGSSHRGFHHTQHHGPIDSYLKVQPVPAEWFPMAPIRKTKTQRKQDPAVYEETFEYDMSQKDDGVSGGYLLLTLKDYNLGRTNTFIGEAVVPLASLPCVDSSLVHTVPNTYIKMTTPGLDIGYKSLRALHFRTGDKIATSFIKKVSKRLLDSKAKSSTLRPEDEKSRSKSPTFKERLKFS